MTLEDHSGTHPLAAATGQSVGVLLTYDALLRRSRLDFILDSDPGNYETSTRVNYGYDAASRLLALTNGSETAAYTYLSNSPLVATLTHKHGGTTKLTSARTYDYLNCLMSAVHTTPTNTLASFAYAYNAANQRTSVTNVDGTRWVYTYDALGQVVSGKKYWADSTPVAGQQFEYGFDDIGNRKTAKDGGDDTGANLRTSTYSANLLNQYSNRTVHGYVPMYGTAATNATVTVWTQPGAIEVAPSSPAGATVRKGEYFWKEFSFGNGTTSLYPAFTNVAVLKNAGSNGLDIVGSTTGRVWVAQSPEVYGHDADGNLTNDGRWVYTWDGENRLVRMETRTNVTTVPREKLEYAYDAQGRRVSVKTWQHNGSTWVPGKDQQFLYDGWNVIARLNQGTLDQGYAWGLDLSGSLQGAGGVGGLLWVREAGGSDESHAVAHDGNGNVAALLNLTSGVETARYEYGPFGETARLTGTFAKENPFRFSTKYQDAETDLYYYGYRSYSAVTGRWLSRDWIMELGGLNISAFCGNSPANAIDRLGLAFTSTEHYWTLDDIEDVVRGAFGFATDKGLSEDQDEVKVVGNDYILERKKGCKFCAKVIKASILNVHIDVVMPYNLVAERNSHDSYSISVRLRGHVKSHERKHVTIWRNGYYAYLHQSQDRGANVLRCGEICRDYEGDATAELQQYLSRMRNDAIDNYNNYVNPQHTALDNHDKDLIILNPALPLDFYDLIPDYDQRVFIPAAPPARQPPSCPPAS